MDEVTIKNIKNAQYQRKWRAKNKDRIRDFRRQQYLKNPEYYRAQRRERYLRNRDAILAKHKATREKSNSDNDAE